MIGKLIIYLTLFQTVVLASSHPPDSVRSYLWGLIQLKSKNSIKYELGYWKDQILHRREFHEPIIFSPAEIRYGLFFYGGGGKDGDEMTSNWIKYDESVAGFDGGSFFARVGHLLDIDFAKTNLFYYGLNASWLDMQTGLNFRFSNLLLPGTLPSESWSNVNPDWHSGTQYFSPKTFTLGISQNMIFQWFELWLIDVHYTWGLSRSKFYLDSSKDVLDTPSIWGPSMSVSLGPRIILDSEKKNRFSVGVDFRYSYTKFNNISDPADLTPIKSIHLQDFGVYATFSIFYGGKLSMGDRAKEYYYRKDYVTAKEHFDTFLTEFPHHGNRHRAELFLSECKIKIPIQLYEEGLQFEQNGMMEKAIERYLDARVRADENSRPIIQGQLDHLAILEIEKAELLSSRGRADEAVQLMKKIAHFSRNAKLKIPVYEARATLQEGEKALQFGFYLRALEKFNEAFQKDNTLEFEVKTLQYQVATHLVEMANNMTETDDLRAALQMLIDAGKMTGGLGEKNEIILSKLKEKFIAKQERKTKGRIDKIMKNVRQRATQIETSPPPTVGMTVPEIQSLLGNPNEIIEKKDKDGTSIQLWIYPLENDNRLILSFQNYILFKIE